MEKIGWKFPPLFWGRQGYTNNDIEGFKGEKLIDNLVREICQNSLDARLENEDAPVRVLFELRKVHRQDFDVFSQYKECLESCRNFWGDDMDPKLKMFLDNAENTLREDYIPILVAGDYNTKGLSGCQSPNGKSSSWTALTDWEGVSVKSDKDSAGSYGIGKNAPFACSSLSMVFYNTLTEDNESAFIGVARLASLLDNENQMTSRVGRYQVNDNEKREWKPIYPENENAFRDSFLRTESGTDVIIVGFTQSSEWFVKVQKAILEYFFVAVSEKKLVVELKDGLKHVVIDANSVAHKFSELEKGDKDIVYASQLYKALTTPSVKGSFEVLEPDDVEIYIKTDASYGNKVANFRAIGMRVGFYPKSNLQNYACVVIIRGKMLGELLKDTEPPCHDKWDYKKFAKTDNKRKEAKQAIENIKKFINDLLGKQEPEQKTTFDAAGVADYLPDDSDGRGNRVEEDDILRAKIKIGKIRTRKEPRGTISQMAVRREGTAKAGEVRNQTRRPNPTAGQRPSVPVDPNPDVQESKSGATPGSGAKTVITPNLTALRAFSVSSAQGLYKIVIKPTEDYDNMFVECSAVGEDEQNDPLEMENFTSDGKIVRLSGRKAGPICVKADTPAVFFVTFKRKEKMKLKLHLTEVSKK